LTGARTGEVLNTTWQQFDTEPGTWIKPASSTKTEREHRVPLSAPAQQLVASLSRNDDRLFPGLVEVRSDWTTICGKARIKGARVHDLRHSFASIAASRGATLPLIGALLGHNSPTTTARYTHLFDDPQREIAEGVGASIVSASGTAPKGQIIDLPRKGGRA
jgi:integrase